MLSTARFATPLRPRALMEAVRFETLRMRSACFDAASCFRRALWFGVRRVETTRRGRPVRCFGVRAVDEGVDAEEVIDRAERSTVRFGRCFCFRASVAAARAVAVATARSLFFAAADLEGALRRRVGTRASLVRTRAGGGAAVGNGAGEAAVASSSSTAVSDGAGAAAVASPTAFFVAAATTAAALSDARRATSVRTRSRRCRCDSDTVARSRLWNGASVSVGAGDGGRGGALSSSLVAAQSARRSAAVVFFFFVVVVAVGGSSIRAGFSCFCEGGRAAVSLLTVAATFARARAD